MLSAPLSDFIQSHLNLISIFHQSPPVSLLSTQSHSISFTTELHKEVSEPRKEKKTKFLENNNSTVFQTHPISTSLAAQCPTYFPGLPNHSFAYFRIQPNSIFSQSQSPRAYPSFLSSSFIHSPIHESIFLNLFSISTHLTVPMPNLLSRLLNHLFTHSRIQSPIISPSQSHPPFAPDASIGIWL